MEHKMEINLLAESLKFMVLGMGIVFLFLFIMIYALKLQAFLIGKYLPETDDKASNSKEWQPANQSNDDIIAAITGAIIHHSKSNKKG
jgi:oxaloacetate decarboxylase gamma subunit